MAGVPVIRADLLAPRQAATLRGCHRLTVLRAITRGELPAYRIDRGDAPPAWAIDPADLDAWTPNPVGRPKETP